jgi:hypothetical protein
MPPSPKGECKKGGYKINALVDFLTIIKIPSRG